MSAISGRRGFIVEADGDRENRADWAWRARPRRRPGGSAPWSPGWRDRVGSGWCADWFRLQADGWRRRVVASADESLSEYQRRVRHRGKPDIPSWDRLAGCRPSPETATVQAARLANTGAAVPVVFRAAEFAGPCGLCLGAPTARGAGHRCRAA